MKNILTLSLIISLVACKSEKTDLDNLPIYNKSGKLQAVIEIPAGSSHKIEFNKENRAFEVDQKEGKDRIINFLPYPGNYGFIPSTYMYPEKGGDGDALDILVLSESQPTGTVMEVIPIALLRIKDNGEIDSKVIAVPADEKLQTFKVYDYETFSKEFGKAKLIVEYWFTNYKAGNLVDEIHWQDEKAVRKEILHWTKVEK